MLVHSMGNIVFKEMIDKHWDNDAYPGVFITKLILNSADVQREHHQQWIEKVSIADEIFSTTTRHDFVLGSVELMLYKPMLGQGFNSDEPSASFASNAHYLDFSNVSSSHRKFGMNKDKYFRLGSDNTKLKTFFKLALSDASWAQCPKGTAIDMELFDYQCVRPKAD